MMNNKGISPLIATVLIIGFTVALAAMIMTWGTDFIRGTTEDVDRQRQTALLCTSQLEFQLVMTQEDCDNNRIFLDNRGALDITAVKLRLHQRVDGTVTTEDHPGVPAFGKTPFDVPNLADLSKVEAIATVKGPDNSEIICTNARKERIVNCQATP